jgi:hypothetical protein
VEVKMIELQHGPSRRCLTDRRSAASAADHIR